MQPVRLCILSDRPFEDTFEKSQWRKVKQMQPVWLCIHSSRRFEETFENSQWGKVKQMQPVWICIISGRQFEETFENPQWRKAKRKCNLCDYASSQASHLRRHLKLHSGVLETNLKCNYFLLISFLIWLFHMCTNKGRSPRKNLFRKVFPNMWTHQALTRT